jgi:hypothetical protein
MDWSGSELLRACIREFSVSIKDLQPFNASRSLPDGQTARLPDPNITQCNVFLADGRGAIIIPK